MKMTFYSRQTMHAWSKNDFFCSLIVTGVVALMQADGFHLISPDCNLQDHRGSTRHMNTCM